MPNIKISGITNTKDAKWAALLGVEYISISLIKDSVKKVSLERAAEILDMLPSYTKSILEIGNAQNDISLKRAVELKPDYFSVNDPEMINMISKKDDVPRQYKYILESSVVREELIREIPVSVDFIEYNLNDENFRKVLEIDFNDNENIIINGDFELDEIVKTCKKILPNVWSIRNIIDKSPRRIDYDKMKEYIREISLI